jgi:hypothetical protein
MVVPGLNARRVTAVTARDGTRIPGAVFQSLTWMIYEVSPFRFFR